MTRAALWGSALAILVAGLLVLEIRHRSSSVVEAEQVDALPSSVVAEVATASTRMLIRAPDVDPFRTRITPAPPAPPPAVSTLVEDTPRPAAPPIPYRFMARVIGVDGKQTVFVTRESRVLATVEGELLDEHYRVDKVDAETLTLTYLPLEEQQSIPAH